MNFETLENRNMFASLADTLRANLINSMNDSTPNSSQMAILDGASYNQNAYLDVDMSGVHHGRKSGTLVSPDIVISAQHFGALPNPLTFIAPDGTKHVRNIIGARLVPGSLDMRMSRLDSPLPPEIATYKLPDPDFNLGDVRTAPVIMLEQNSNMHIGRVHPDAGEDASYATIIKDKGKFGKLYKNLVGGDSGHPAFFVSGEDLVLVTTWHFPQLGPYTGTHQDAMRQTAKDLGSTYELESIEWGLPEDYTESTKGNKGKRLKTTGVAISDNYLAALYYNSVDEETLNLLVS